MNWIHCNTCYIQPGQDGPQFTITSCGHIYCVRCLEKVSPEKCHICQAAFTTTELNAEMKPEIKEYFSDPDELIQKAHVINVFQGDHRARLFTRLRGYQNKYAALREEAVKCTDENIRLRKKIKHMEITEGYYKSEIALLKRKLKDAREEISRLSPAKEFASPAPSLRTPSSSYGSSRRLPKINNANQYRSQPTYTPFTTPSSNFSSFPHTGRTSDYTRSSTISTSDMRYQNSNRSSQAMRTPSEFSSPSVLRPLNFQANRVSQTPVFRRNI